MPCSASFSAGLAGDYFAPIRVEWAMSGVLRRRALSSVEAANRCVAESTGRGPKTSLRALRVVSRSTFRRVMEPFLLDLHVRSCRSDSGEELRDQSLECVACSGRGWPDRFFDAPQVELGCRDTGGWKPVEFAAVERELIVLGGEG